MGKGINCESKEDGWLPSVKRHRHVTKPKKKYGTSSTTETVRIENVSTLNTIQVSGQAMTTPRMLNGVDKDEECIEVVKKEQNLSSSFITSMLLASIKELSADRHRGNIDALSIDHVPCAVYERVQLLLFTNAFTFSISLN